MEWGQQRGRGGHMHEWGIRWDITGRLAAQNGPIVTHEYRYMSESDASTSQCLEAHRVQIGLVADTDGETPWGVKPEYRHQVASKLEAWGGVAWQTVSTHATHDAALASVEAEATRLGWRS
jgi:hypothetical protein